MGELQVFSLVADPTWHNLIWVPTCFSCRAAELSFCPGETGGFWLGAICNPSYKVNCIFLVFVSCYNLS